MKKAGLGIAQIRQWRRLSLAGRLTSCKIRWWQMRQTMDCRKSVTSIIFIWLIMGTCKHLIAKRWAAASFHEWQHWALVDSGHTNMSGSGCKVGKLNPFPQVNCLINRSFQEKTTEGRISWRTTLIILAVALLIVQFSFKFCTTKIKRHRPFSKAVEIYYERTVLSTRQIKF